MARPEGTEAQVGPEANPVQFSLGLRSCTFLRGMCLLRQEHAHCQASLSHETLLSHRLANPCQDALFVPPTNHASAANSRRETQIRMPRGEQKDCSVKGKDLVHCSADAGDPSMQNTASDGESPAHRTLGVSGRFYRGRAQRYERRLQSRKEHTTCLPWHVCPQQRRRYDHESSCWQTAAIDHHLD